jgi:hypothetical protein
MYGHEKPAHPAGFGLAHRQSKEIIEREPDVGA